MSTRLYRSIIVFGTALGAGAVVTTGCDLFTADHHQHVDAGGFGIIDAWHSNIADAAFGIIDAPSPDAASDHHDAAPDAHHSEGDA